MFLPLKKDKAKKINNEKYTTEFKTKIVDQYEHVVLVYICM